MAKSVDKLERYCLIEDIGGAKRRVKNWYITKQQDDSGKVSWVVTYPPLTEEQHIYSTFEGAKLYGAQIYDYVKGVHDTSDGTVRLLYWDEVDPKEHINIPTANSKNAPKDAGCVESWASSTWWGSEESWKKERERIQKQLEEREHANRTGELKRYKAQLRVDGYLDNVVVQATSIKEARALLDDCKFVADFNNAWDMYCGIESIEEDNNGRFSV